MWWMMRPYLKNEAAPNKYRVISMHMTGVRSSRCLTDQMTGPSMNPATLSVGGSAAEMTMHAIDRMTSLGMSPWAWAIIAVRGVPMMSAMIAR